MRIKWQRSIETWPGLPLSGKLAPSAMPTSSRRSTPSRGGRHARRDAGPWHAHQAKFPTKPCFWGEEMRAVLDRPPLDASMPTPPQLFSSVLCQAGDGRVLHVRSSPAALAGHFARRVPRSGHRRDTRTRVVRARSVPACAHGFR
jgi:hypothetical protein